MTEGEFKELLLQIDPMVIVDFESLPYGVRVTPYGRNPRTNKMLVETALRHLPLGICLQFPSDEWETVYYRDYMEIKQPKTLIQYLKFWWKNRRKDE